MKELFKRGWPDLLVVIAFLLLSFFYFSGPVLDGLVLGGHDTVAGMGQGQEQSAFFQQTGERTRWTNAIFSGMPTYQIAPTYGPTETLSWVGRALGLFTSGPVSYLFLYLLGFYLLMRAFRFKPLLSVFGAVAWTFSTYFLIIIAAGHIWKVNTLAFIPPTIAGLVLAYRGKWLRGAMVTALFTALQVLSNHLQMTYYFLFLMAFIVVAYGVEAVRRGTMGNWLRATAAVAVGGVLGALVNLPNLYHTWEYSKESMRGSGELTAKTAPADGRKATGGLERDYITAWSYGIDETFTLMIANFKGGGSQSILDREGVESLEGYDAFYEHAGQLQQATGSQMVPGAMQYWGDQPMTVGPVYVGAIICFLFVLALFLVDGPMKWALLCGTCLSFLFAWGKHVPALTDFFIDHLPMYAKFRTVSSALVVAEFTMPLLAVLGLAEVVRQPERLFGTRQGRIAFGVSFAATAGLCLFFALAPGVTSLLSEQDAAMFGQLAKAGLPADFTNSYRSAVQLMHGAILSADAWRSFFLIVFAALLIALHVKRPRLLSAPLLVGLLLVITLGDLWNVNRRYLNDDNFTEPATRLEGFAETAADATILRDRALDYRVLNLSAGNPFNESDNRTAFRHKSIGGYHAAKLHRYQDLIDRHLMDETMALASGIEAARKAVMTDSLHFAARGIQTEAQLMAAVEQELPKHAKTPLLNMLNARWIILSAETALRNTAAQGNGWFVRQLTLVDNADAEMAALGKTDLRTAAVADRRFAGQLDGVPLGTGTVRLDSYAPNELHYTTESEKGGVVVLSEIYYPGWTATIDGQPVELGRANYLLRALRVPKGRHTVVLTFRPASVSTTNAIAYTALALLLLGLIAAFWPRRARKDVVAE